MNTQILTIEHFLSASKNEIPKLWRRILTQDDKNTQIMFYNELDALYNFVESTEGK